MRTFGRIVRYVLIMLAIALLAGIFMVGWKFLQTRLESVSVVTPEQGASVDKVDEVTEPAEVEITSVPAPELEPNEVQENQENEFPENLFMTPVEAQKIFNEASAWLIAEPGVFLDATATFDRGNSSGEHFGQCPEGGFFYASMGGGTIDVVDSQIDMVSGEGINNLVVVRCRIDDGLQDTDLNLSVKVFGYKPGHIITSPMPAGAYVSADWFAQQLTMSAGNEDQSGGNCGASGCSKTYIHLLDLDSGFYQVFLMEKPEVSSWELIK